MADVKTMEDRQPGEQLPGHLPAIALGVGYHRNIPREVPERDILHREEHGSAGIFEPAKQLYE